MDTHTFGPTYEPSRFANYRVEHELIVLPNSVAVVTTVRAVQCGPRKAWVHTTDWGWVAARRREILPLLETHKDNALALGAAVRKALHLL